MTNDRKIAALRCWFKAVETKLSRTMNDNSFDDWARYYAKTGIDGVTKEELEEASEYFNWDFIVP